MTIRASIDRTPDAAMKTILNHLVVSAVVATAGCAGSDGGAQASGGAPATTGIGGKPAAGGTDGSESSTPAGGGGSTGGTGSTGGNGNFGGPTTAGSGAGSSNSRGGAGGTGGDSADIWGGPKNPPRKSAGCDKTATLTTGKKTITSGGVSRSFIIDVPANYDPAKPYRLFYVSHGQGGRAEDVAGWNYFGLKTEATAANVPSVFVAGQGLNNTWSEVDHVFFDDVTAFVKSALCIDTTRVFVSGMSMGGMYTYSLSTDRQKGFRAGVGLAPTNFNIWLPNPRLTEPIAWMQTTGMSDPICSWVTNEAQKRGSKFIALEKATNNGCIIPASIPTWQSGNHLCYDFTGCKLGYPVKTCTFNGGHVDGNRDPGSNVNWIAKESWEFFVQF